MNLFVVISFAILVILAVFLTKKLKIENSPDDGTKYGNYVYLEYESNAGFWAHNDSLYLLAIERTDHNHISDWSKINTDEGWEIASYRESEPDGSCNQHIERYETRKNGLSFYYEFAWRERCWWYPDHDLIRMLFDKDFFMEKLMQAKRGDVIFQTLVGCCYGHNGKMGLQVVEHDIEKALYWWNKAAANGFTPAMVELAIYHWGKKEYNKAFEWNEKSGGQVFVIEYHRKLQSQDSVEVD